ncbi:hypothetical protein PR202_ga17090 [Eleusine coracana subsp. coracana]|uniref:Peptidase A1 domain-containing protein n=1 Tax=Eleusine coracana subsp. coracana TaxID=191504 RepID=A0AAV5CPJ0_ELECO|nr:hypothetical protein PR202_ga17090 [Eleusine coracana subsp. coracana]
MGRARVEQANRERIGTSGWGPGSAQVPLRPVVGVHMAYGRWGEAGRHGEADSNNKLPLIHRAGPCSPLNRGTGESNPARSTDVFDRDAHRLRAISASVHSGLGDAPSPAPASDVTAPVTVQGNPFFKGGLDYSVMVGYGTPTQLLPMEFDTLYIPGGASALRCKPCRSGTNPCDPAFDPARSSSFADVPCGPECPSVCHGSTCSFNVTDSEGSVLANGTFVEDTLTLSPSATFTSFVAACMDVDNMHNGSASSGILDLSQSRFSLVSRVISSSSGNTTAAFSYCLPGSTTSTRGFLTIGGALPDLSGNGAGSTPLVNFPISRNKYIIELGGINVGGTELPAPQPSLAALEVGTLFTYLKPQIYRALRDEFRKQMAQYPAAQPYRVLDTCYNFTGLPTIEVPVILLEFKGGVTLTPDVRQMMYFLPDHLFSIGCLAFAATPQEYPFSVIGNMAQQTVEVVYDVRGGKVGFIQGSC